MPGETRSLVVRDLFTTKCSISTNTHHIHYYSKGICDTGFLIDREMLTALNGTGSGGEVSHNCYPEKREINFATLDL